MSYSTKIKRFNLFKRKANMILDEKYLAQFERNSGLKKGTVGTKNHLHESYMQDARENGSEYQFFIVMDSNGMSKIIGGNDYKQDALDAANEYLESGIRLKVYSGKFLKGKGIDPEDDSNWGNQDDINAAMQAAGGLQENGQIQQEAVAGVPSQEDVDAYQAGEYEGNDEPENDKDAESQDALHLGEGSTPLGLAHGHLNKAGEERRNAMTGQADSPKRDRYVNSALGQLGHARQEKAFNDNPQKADSARAKTYAAQGKTGRVIPENEEGFGEDDGTPGWPRATGLVLSPDENASPSQRPEPQVCIGLDPNWMKIGQQEQDIVAELDNMMGGNETAGAPAMSGGDEWMDAPNEGQMNSLDGGGDELELGESQEPNLYGTRAGVAKSMDANAEFRKNILPQAKPHQKSMAHSTAKFVAQGTTTQRKSGQNFGQFKQLPEQALALNEDSKALYAKAKVDEAQYERFLKNAGVKK
jgi:hypothetical protein